MSNAMIALLICNLASVASVIGAAYVASIGQDGWGWLLFIAVMLHATPGDGA